MKRVPKIVAGIVAVVGAFALASYLTTSVIWDGGFPSGVFQVNVRDEDGKPVRGAVLRVYHGGTRDPAFEYPLDDHRSACDLVSDEDGRIKAVRRRGGLQFGGHAWRLFWLVPMGAQPPRYDCEVTADGFKPLQFPVWRLFVSPRGSYEELPKAKVELDGKEVELRVYEHTFMLKR